jgi:hypothetical protein
VLDLLIAVVADVIEDQLGPVADRQPVLHRHRSDRIDHALMHHAAKADPRIVSPQPVLVVRRGVGERTQEDAQRHLASGLQALEQTVTRDPPDEGDGAGLDGGAEEPEDPPLCAPKPCAFAHTTQSRAMICCALISCIWPSQTRRRSAFSTWSFAFGDPPGSGHRLRGSLTAPPSSSGIRWSYSYLLVEPLSAYASMLARFSESVTLSSGRTDAVQPLTQIVRSIVACITAGFKAPGVQWRSGSE